MTLHDPQPLFQRHVIISTLSISETIQDTLSLYRPLTESNTYGLWKLFHSHDLDRFSKLYDAERDLLATA